MTTIHIHSDQTNLEVAQFTGANVAECERWAVENYGTDDFWWDFSAETGGGA